MHYHSYHYLHHGEYVESDTLRSMSMLNSHFLLPEGVAISAVVGLLEAILNNHEPCGL